MLKKCLALVLLISMGPGFAQEKVQTVKGRITEKTTETGLSGIRVQLLEENGQTLRETLSDSDGYFSLKDVPVGRRAFFFSSMLYQGVHVRDVIVHVGKEVVLNVTMEERVADAGGAEVKASDTDAASDLNVKIFQLEETSRYPASREDPARMVSNYAGVQGTNDSRNDIIVRGNSPAGILWRLEEIDIPNPNHFAVAGTAGGPQTIINNKYLANSAFYNGAFPANYGNALGGVFDLRMRNGNNEKHERTIQLGVLGTELGLEGPISKKNGSSYLINYRYSTLALFSSVNFKLGTSAIPKYQDVGLRLNFPTKRAGVFSLSAIGGLSKIAIILSTQRERPKELYGDQNRDQYFATNMGVAILSHTYPINGRFLMKTSLALSGQDINSNHYLILRNRDYLPNDTLPRIQSYDFQETKQTLSWFIKGKFDAKNSIRTGFFAHFYQVHYFDEYRPNSLYDTVAKVIDAKPWHQRVNAKDQFLLLQPYVDYEHTFNEAWRLHAGVFSQWLSLNNSWSVEPRASVQYQPSAPHAFSLAAGLHSQMQATYVYYATPDSLVRNGKTMANTAKIQDNKQLDFSRSAHVVLGYDWQQSSYFHIRTEAYYQYLWNIPVYAIPSGISLINRGATFTRFFPMYTMVNTGTGYNYGLELTLEKRFHKHYFFLYSASLYTSKYKASNGRTYNTDFNGNYMMNFLGGVEYAVGRSKKNSLQAGLKFTLGGGKRYSPANLAASNAIMDVVPEEDKINTLQFPAYNRLDFRLAYRINGNRMGWELSLDLINVMNTSNVLALSYAPDPANLKANPLVNNYQLGFLPLLNVKVDF